MPRKLLLIGLCICGVTLQVASPVAAGVKLSLQDRIEAQTAIERVYHSHRTAHRSFEEDVPASVIEEKVRTYLLQSMALERVWNTPVTSEMLAAEMKRITSNTRFPDRLEEIYSALGNDPLFIQEYFVRPSLVNRLTRSFFAGDRGIHQRERFEAEELRDQIERGELDPSDDHARKVVLRHEAEGDLHDAIRDTPRAFVAHSKFMTLESARHIHLSESSEAFDITVTQDDGATRYRVPKRSWESWWSHTKATLGEPLEPDTSLPPDGPEFERPLAPICGPDDVWENGSLDDGVPEARARHTAVWTGSEVLIWGGFVRRPAGVTFTSVGLRYDPLTDTWSFMSAVNAPVGRIEHAAVWTGTEMIVWGGRQGTPNFNTGGRYDPVNDTWSPTSLANAPSARVSHTAVWADDVMVIWGGAADNSGGRYDPQTDSWTQVSTTDAPSPRGGHVAVWTGNEMLVWGGGSNTGGRYDPSSDTWLAMTTTNAPPPRGPCAAVWTGTEMIIWGGSFLNSGGRYSPSADTWTTTATAGAPLIRLVPTGVWTGNEMIVWGGQVGCCGGVTNTGGRYNPTTNTWAPTDTTHAPSERAQHSAVWTGDRMLVWGGLGFSEEGYRFDGSRYDPITNSWTPMLGTTNKPSPRYDHSAVWTGSEMVIWGGQDDYAYLGGGFHYDPLIDDWTAIDALNSPAPRVNHRAVWTGNRMIIWGGYGGTHLNTGGRYDPVAGTWEPTSTVGAPSGRSGHSAVWTGNIMVVWGGGPPTGGRYDPIADTWMPTSLTGAPSGRGYHSAVWTGSRMIIWGGWDGSTSLATGGRYDPVNDAWEATSTAGVPLGGRVHHSAVWTGEEMIVYGGSDAESAFNDGFKYQPDTDVWEPISMDENSPILSGHSAFWTGRVMIVWGGIGGRYDPARDTWSSMATIDAPLAGAHSEVWTGSAMIVWDSYYLTGTGGVYLVDTSNDDDHDGFTACGGDCDDSSSSVYAGAPQVCDGVNNDCTDPTWPAISGTDEGDDDGDAFTECQGDCDDSDATAWGLPSAVAGLELSDPSTLSWDPPAQPGGSAVLYDTLRASMPIDFVTSMTCVESDASSTTTTDVFMPPPGAIAYYLTRAQNACGLGSAGTASNGTPRSAGDCGPATSMPGARLAR